MKYVMFKMGITLIPVVVPEHCTHKQIKIAGAKPNSAGFFNIKTGGVIKVSSKPSESLKLGPNVERDENLLRTMFSGTFTDQSYYFEFNESTDQKG